MYYCFYLFIFCIVPVQFKQTADLRDITSPFIAGLRHLLHSSVRQWLIDITGIPLSEVMDMGSSRYSQTGILSSYYYYYSFTYSSVNLFILYDEICRA